MYGTNGIKFIATAIYCASQRCWKCCILSFLFVFVHFYFRHDKENSVTSAIVTINSGGNGPGQGGHNGGPGPGPDQAGHIGPIQMYSSSTASIPDPAAQVSILFVQN